MISNNEHDHRNELTHNEHRGLRVESLENRNLLAADLDDSLSEARPLGLVSEQPMSVAADISEATDVDMVRVTLGSGQSIDIDVDTPTNGPGGLGGFLRVFNEQGLEVAFNNDAMAPDDGAIGFDPYIRFTAQQNGNYYIAVSNWANTLFDPIGGEGDMAGQEHATGSYVMTVKGVPQFDSDDAISEAIALGGAGPTRYSVDGMIDSDIDVDMYRIELGNGQDVEFDIDTVANGPGGLGSYLTLFDANGNFVASNDDGVAPGETLGFDAYLRLSVAMGGPYYLAVSNYGNTSFSPITGDGDTGGSMYATGTYRLTIGEVLPGSVITASDMAAGDSQAAPMIGSMFDSMAAASLSSTADANLDGQMLTSSEDTSVLNGSDDLDSELQVNESFDSQASAAPPIFSPLDASSSMMSAGLASAGTTAFNFGPGQSALDSQIDSRTALATDLALMQSI